MNWLQLITASFLELCFVLCLEKSHGKNNKYWLAAALLSMLGSIFLLGKAVQGIPLGTAYAIWTGIGSLLSVGYGIIFLGEPKSAKRMFFIVCIVSGVAGLKIFA